MKELVIIIRPEKLEKLKSILDAKQCGGMTISSVMGCGTQKGVVEDNAVNVIKGFKTNINLLPKIRVEVVVSDSEVEDIITELRDKIPTGHVGDGKVFIRDIAGAVRLRTGERDDKAL
ncbi:MAG: P-II family nitrogen regulator [Firmicutes bacterium]|nr:P-II family nitrogen regulator [Bacillota bacterium]